MAKEFDLDVTFDEKEPDLSQLTPEQLEAAVEGLPEAIRSVARGVLIEKRTMSDVSQGLGIRQAELVTRLHRAKHFIAIALAPQSLYEN
jgi:DNA-directed RNA polymerase specialized sigma24 family protein